MKHLMVGVLALLAFGCAQKLDFSKVVPASSKQLALIKRGLDPGLTIRKGYAVKSRNYKNAYYVSALVDGQRTADVGVWWISGNKERPGMILSVDGFAFVYSSYPKAKRTRVGAGGNDSEVKLLKAYMERESESLNDSIKPTRATPAKVTRGKTSTTNVASESALHLKQSGSR